MGKPGCDPLLNVLLSVRIFPGAKAGRRRIVRVGIVGIDVGAVSVSVVETDSEGKLLRHSSLAHDGDIVGTLERCLSDYSLYKGRVVATTSSPKRLLVAKRVDNLVAAIRAARLLHPGLGALLLVGAERFSLSVFGQDGSYRESRFNSLCAAGTGSFLDQQARRLGLDTSADLAAIAEKNTGDRPRIATRCAVFAKTDLIHAQQEGYALDAICDGLCHGLAANVHDALFSDQPITPPIVFAGGVALNRAVVRHMSQLTGLPMEVDTYSQVYCAYGAALDLLQSMENSLSKDRRSLPKDTNETMTVNQLLGLLQNTGPSKHRGYFPPLGLTKGFYPDFSSDESYEFEPRCVKIPGTVEVSTYSRLTNGETKNVWLGVDIGSTSTKAVLLGVEDDMDADGDEGVDVVAGFYTRTAGRPLLAVQAILEAIRDWEKRYGAGINILGAGTTGSGRKFIGSLVGADLVLDEITAHAKAAVVLDPQVDTIIEIGGQDAKFTTLNNGIVTQSIMNHVCAAGTGSFIEEQAQRLGCDLDDMAERTNQQRAPLASDRCTVFMERDINHFLSDGYDVDEVLCSVLHAVRDNYLQKVAREGNIGKRVCFQGATAKNRSLVAAFEQKLERPVSVSRYCHLTGALGVALELREHAEKVLSGQSASHLAPSGFKGVDLYLENIPVKNEICDLCNNHCKLRIAEVYGETIGFGYLCGRDPDEEKFVSANASGFDLLKARKRHFRVKKSKPRRQVTIGLPAALHMVDDLAFWEKFFDELGVKTVTSSNLKDPVSKGKALANAEFCAPMSAWHAHVASLQDRADYIFTPFYLEAERPKHQRRQYCYYTQFAPSLSSGMNIPGLAEKCIKPLLHTGERTFSSWGELHKSLVSALGKDLPKSEVIDAYKAADKFMQQKRADLLHMMQEQLADTDDLSVVFLGRPYTVLSEQLNSSIPDIFAKHGIKTFYQDMVQPVELGEVQELVNEIGWANVQKIFSAAVAVAKTPGLYPVLLTAFKCGPDSCTLEYFRRLMNSHSKPYLILQLDEHDSQVGYETRVEAAIRAFRNHFEGFGSNPDRHILPMVPHKTQKSDGRVLFIPPWDTFASPLFVEGMKEVGIDARLIEETTSTIQQSLGYNTGQCIPLNIIVHEFARSVQKADLDPAKCALWMPNSSISCNISFYPQYSKGLLETIGGGFEKSTMYAGETTAIEISPRASLNAYFAYLFGGTLRRLQCKTRPYELDEGTTDRVTAQGLEIFKKALAGKIPKTKAAKQVVDLFLAVDTERAQRPKVALFGDLYVRDNDVLNQDLIRVIEQHGGEVVTTPYTEYARIIAKPYMKKWLREGLYKDFLLSAPFVLGMDLIERPFKKEFVKVLGENKVVNPQGSMEEILSKFHLRTHHTGESFDNVLKIFHLLERYPDLALFVQTNPAFCCPSLVTEAMAGEIERHTGIPIVTVTYDGTGSFKNDVVIPYLELLQDKTRRGSKDSRLRAISQLQSRTS